MIYSQRDKVKIFGETDCEELFQDIRKRIVIFINKDTDDYILNVDESDYIKHIISMFEIDNLELDFDNKYIELIEHSIPGEFFPSGCHVDKDKYYNKQVIKYCLPFLGTRYLLFMIPNPRIEWTTEVAVEEDIIFFEIINFYSDPNKIKREANEILNNVNSLYRSLYIQIEGFNNNLREFIVKAISRRKQDISQKNNFLAALDVPVKVKENVPKTFSVPKPEIREKIVIEKPDIVESKFKPEPTLNEKVYFKIISIINEVGQQFEKLPSTYKDKKEEDLRDHILLFLEPNFEGSATGETFNKTGKTDILLRYEGSNVFIAECKFWNGEKYYFEAISQLIKYLTWRDSKTAVIIFVKNKDFTSVLNCVKSSTQNHQNFLECLDNSTETWFNFKFRLNDDQEREIRLAVLLFHIP